jgi:colicin import membrane protein
MRGARKADEMRAGWAVSVIGHVGAVMMTLLVWEAHSAYTGNGGTATVPVDIVDVAPESNVRALSTEPSEETAPPPTSDDTSVEPPAPTPPPAPSRRPRRTAAQEQADALNDVTQGLTDRSRHDDPRHAGAQGDRNQEGAGRGTADVAALQDLAGSLIKRAMVRCWRMPADLPDPERLIVTLRFRLNRNGTLSGQPDVVDPHGYQFDPPMQQAVNTALRAVRSCDFSFLPSDPRLGAHYEIWRENDYTFKVENAQ